MRKLRNLSPFAFSRSSISFTPLIVILGLGLFGFTILSSILFTSPSVHAENVRYDVNINSSLTLGFSADTVSLNLNPGSQVFDSQDITTTVSTNNQYGYDLYVTSSGTDLINQTDNTYTIPTLPAKEGGYDVDTFLADKWGVMMNNTSYQPFVSGTTVSQSSTVTNADNTILTFGAKTSYNTAPGNYKLALNFQLVARVATNDLTINFAGEGVESVKVCTVAGDCAGDNLIGTVTTSGNSVPGLKDGSSYYLYPVFTSGYEFVSWEKTSDAGTISDTDILNPTFTMSDEPAAVTITGKSSMLAMQDITPSQCTTTAQTVYDKRDNEQYLIQRLADGNCWLLDNLRLGSAEFANGTTALDSTNTNTANSINTSIFNGWKATSGFSTYTVPLINVEYANDTTTSYGAGSGKMGVYYNYCAASMNTYCMASGSGSGNATEDVCPKGWRMPTGGSSGEYQALCNAVKGSTCSNGDTSSAALQLRNVLSTPLSGYFYNSSAVYQGSDGTFWSSTYSNGYSMYGLYVFSSDVHPQDYDGYRYVGISVRCVLNDTRTISDVSNMQDVNSAVVTNTADGTTATLRDKRDEQEYTVAKINGNLWMTRNLAIGCNGAGSTYGSEISSKSLTSEDSNVTNTSDNPWNTPTTSLTSGNSYNDPRMTCSSTYGAWYNYAAASAGIITSSSNTSAQTYDICPAGWRLPTNSEQSGITSQATAFSPVTGGYYEYGSFGNTGYGLWWSATAGNSASRYYLRWNGSSLDTDYGNRDSGFYVRCIRSS